MVAPLNGAYLDMINGFRNDCQNLIKKFRQQKSDSFGAFEPVWKLHKFSFIYEKYRKIGWISEFKRDTLEIAKYIMLHEHFLGGLYLLYGLCYVQEDLKACVRLEQHEFEKLLTLLMEERESLVATSQPGIMVARLLKNNAFDFVRFSRDYCMESQNRARTMYSGQLMTSQQNNTVNASRWFGNFLKKIDFIDELKIVEEGYFQKKRKLKKENPELNLGLDMVPDDIIAGIEKSLSQETSFSPRPLSIGEKRVLLKSRKRKFKHRYGEPKKIKAIEKEPLNKKKGAPKGMRKLYLKVMINEPASEDDSYGSDEDDLKLSLPDLD